jgi:PST family polysaccharide transporter
MLTALIGGSLITQSFETIDLWFQSQSQSRLSVIAKVGAYIISNTIKVILILIKAPLISFASVILLEGILTTLGLLIVYKQYPCNAKWISTKNFAKRLLSESWPFLLSGFSVIVYMRIDQIMIRQALGLENLGIYAAVLPFATIWQVIPVSLNLSLAPFVARLKAQDEGNYWRALQKIFKIYALIGWVACLLTIAFGQLLVSTFYGKDYQEGVIVLSIYVFTNLFINMGMAQGLWIINEKKSLIGLVNSLFGAIVCAIGNYYLIPLYGIVGAAIVAVLAQIVSTILTNLYFSRRIFLMQVQSLFWPFFKV